VIIECLLCTETCAGLCDSSCRGDKAPCFSSRGSWGHLHPVGGSAPVLFLLILLTLGVLRNLGGACWGH
jgi:preprotein translocase subunit SecG